MIKLTGEAGGLVYYVAVPWGKSPLRIFQGMRRDNLIGAEVSRRPDEVLFEMRRERERIVTLRGKSLWAVDRRSGSYARLLIEGGETCNREIG